MKASEIVRKGTRPLYPGYEVALSWKKNPPQFENNMQVAMQRLSGLLKKLEKEPEYETAYRIPVQKYIDDGYAQPIIDQQELDYSRQWFLPHHWMYKESADKKKLRIVWDAAAEYKGKSLNNSLMTGPHFKTSSQRFFLNSESGP